LCWCRSWLWCRRRWLLLFISNVLPTFLCTTANGTTHIIQPPAYTGRWRLWGLFWLLRLWLWLFRHFPRRTRTRLMHWFGWLLLRGHTTPRYNALSCKGMPTSHPIAGRELTHHHAPGPSTGHLVVHRWHVLTRPTLWGLPLWRLPLRRLVLRGLWLGTLGDWGTFDCLEASQLMQWCKSHTLLFTHDSFVIDLGYRRSTEQFTSFSCRRVGRS
jgi:hypothetical protein